MKLDIASTMLDPVSMVFAVLFIAFSGLLGALLLAAIWWRERTGEGVVQVIVLGDAGRSPRMQYHCLSLVQQNYTVDLVGYGGSPLIKELRDSPRLILHLLTEPPRQLRVVPRLLRYVLKVLFQALNLLWVILVHTKKPSHILVQTPPAIPTLAVCVLQVLLRGSKLVVDYHNYGHTLLALSLGRQHLIVRLARQYERLFAGFAHANLCVSEAMKKDLSSSLGIHAMILYDRPASMFHPTSTENKHKLFEKLAVFEAVFRAEASDSSREEPEGRSVTVFSDSSPAGVVRLRKNRPFLIVSSTSWTEDEDFGILLEALEMYDQRASKNETHTLPRIVCVITGKGPLKQYYERLIAEKKWTHVTICTMWLSTEDYPALLGSADLGVCLHKSSSGLDLPMKVVDMFGCGLPVCAVNYNCLHELVRHDHNGLVFSDSKELAEQIEHLSRGFPSRNVHLSRFRDNLSSFQSLRWDHYWKLHVLPLIAPPQ